MNMRVQGAKRRRWPWWVLFVLYVILTVGALAVGPLVTGLRLAKFDPFWNDYPATLRGILDAPLVCFGLGLFLSTWYLATVPSRGKQARIEAHQAHFRSFYAGLAAAALAFVSVFPDVYSRTQVLALAGLIGLGVLILNDAVQSNRDQVESDRHKVLRCDIDGLTREVALLQAAISNDLGGAHGGPGKVEDGIPYQGELPIDMNTDQVDGPASVSGGSEHAAADEPPGKQGGPDGVEVAAVEGD